MARTWILFFEQLVGALATNSGGITEALAQALQPINEVPMGTIDGVNKVFTLSYAPLAGWLVLHLDNALEDPIADYSLAGNVITYAIAPQPGDNMHAWYFTGAKGTGGGSGAAPLNLPPATGFARHFAYNAADQIAWGPGTAFTNLVGDMSFGCWLKLDSFTPGSLRNSICRAGNSAGGLQLGTTFWLAIGGTAGLGTAGPPWNITYKHNSIPVVVSNTFNVQLGAGAWYYVGFSRQGLTLTLYIGNGESLLAAGSFSWAGADVPNNQSEGGDFYLGNDGLFSADPLGGAIEETYIWTRALTAAEHTAAMQGSPPSGGLMFECVMGNSTPLDLATSGATATVTGTTVVTGHPVF
jgi:hypothetical protein